MECKLNYKKKKKEFPTVNAPKFRNFFFFFM